VPTMQRGCATLLIVLSLAGCGHDKRETPSAAAPTRAAPPPDTSSEHLLAQTPDGWLQTFHTEGPGIRMVEYVPPGDDASDWVDKLSFESFSDPPLPDPIQMLKSIADDQRKTCQVFSDHDTFSGVENDYPTSVRLFVCFKNPLTGKGQLTLVKTIRGDAHFYVITRARRLSPIDPNSKDADVTVKKAVAEWSAYLRAIGVCDPSNDRHPCPSELQRTPSEPQKTTDEPLATAKSE
jgi:hypothetical protein